MLCTNVVDSKDKGPFIIDFSKQVENKANFHSLSSSFVSTFRKHMQITHGYSRDDIKERLPLFYYKKVPNQKKAYNSDNDEESEE